MEYRLASKDELERIWDFNIAENSEDERWVDWKKEYIGYNLNGEAFTFLVLDADVPIGEGTLILSPAMPLRADCPCVMAKKLPILTPCVFAKNMKEMVIFPN